MQFCLQFHLGESFYVGIASMLIFLLALALDITGAVLLCVTAKSPLSSRSQLYYGAEDYAERKEAHPCSDDAQMQRSMIENNYNESLVVPVLWKYPKMTRVWNFHTAFVYLILAMQICGHTHGFKGRGKIENVRKVPNIFKNLPHFLISGLFLIRFGLINFNQK